MDQLLITKRLVLGVILGCSPWLGHAIFENKLSDTERTRSYRVITDGLSVIYFGRNTLFLSDSWMLYLGSYCCGAQVTGATQPLEMEHF